MRSKKLTPVNVKRAPIRQIHGGRKSPISHGNPVGANSTKSTPINGHSDGSEGAWIIRRPVLDAAHNWLQENSR
jgi:hypothetical protein